MDVRDKTLYDTLSVPVGATQEDIKQAYRRLSRIYHPDKQDGNEEKFKQVAYAYHILSNPESRQRYDATGKGEEISIEVEIRSTLIATFQEGIREGADHILDHANNTMNMGEIKLNMSKEKILALKERMLEKKAKIRTHGEVNLFHSLVDQEIEQIENVMQQIAHKLKVVEGCRLILDTYSSDEERREDIPTMFGFTEGEVASGVQSIDALLQEMFKQEFGGAKRRR